MTRATAALDQSIAIENCMDGAFGGHWNTGEPAHQAFPDFASTPAGVLTLHVQDVVLHLEGELIRVPKGTSAPVRQPLQPHIPGSDRKSCNRSCGKSRTLCKVPPLARRLAGEPQTAVFHPLPNPPFTASLPPQKGEKCNLCVRYDLLPMCRVAHCRFQSPFQEFTYSSSLSLFRSLLILFG
jgi:hypothetical protein